MANSKCLIRNNASRATVYKSRVHAQGSFKVVYKGVYTAGDRKGEECVVKEMRAGPSWLESVFEHELEVVEQSAQIIDKFNEAGHIDKPIMMTQPQVWQWDDNGYEYDGAYNLTEPLLDNFERFNSNTGWTPKQQRGWTQVMQALSHFSYHATGGTFVLCDLQGAVYSDCVVLTDPVVHSRDRRFGATDMGAKGIQNFFHRHKCNDYCSCAWSQPRKTHSYFKLRSGTSMMGRDGQWLVPTRKTKPPLNL